MVDFVGESFSTNSAFSKPTLGTFSKVTAILATGLAHGDGFKEMTLSFGLQILRRLEP